MDMNSKIIPMHLHPLGFIEAFTNLGANIEELLKNTGINKNMFSRKDVKISYTQHNQLIRNGLAVCKQPGLGLLVGQSLDWSYNGSVGYVVHTSPSLNAATAAFIRFLTIAQPFYEAYFDKPCFYIDTDDTVVYPLSFLGSKSDEEDVHTFEMEYRLALVLRICDLCGNKTVDDTSVHVRLSFKEPEHAYLYRQLPCTSVRFNCDKSEISADIDYVMKPWRLLRKNSFYSIMNQCEDEFCGAGIEANMTNKVRWLIGHLYYCQRITLEKMASLLRMTPRALTRRLSNEGTSFRNIMRDVQMEITLYHLKRSKLSIEEISDLMGFSSASSLRRAVKNWSGLSVGEVKGEEGDHDFTFDVVDQRQAS